MIQLQNQKFGKYDLNREFSGNYIDTVYLQGVPSRDIHMHLHERFLDHRGDLLILSDFMKEADFMQDNISIGKSLYHVKDATVTLLHNNSEPMLSIYHKDKNKREEARRFLEELLR